MVSKEQMLQDMQKDADDNGYFLCPDQELLDELIDGLVKNEDRYGYGSCPCRMSSGVRSYDADIVCPCEYRDADVSEFGMCYCGLFVSERIRDDPSGLEPIPERRPESVIDEAVKAKERKDKGLEEEAPTHDKAEEVPVWRCKVCGYLAAREFPPSVCPICKAKKEKFVRFRIT